MRARLIVSNFLLSLLISMQAFAGPDWKRFEIVSGMKIFSDSFSATTYYYPPPKLALALDRQGRPDVKLYSLLYSGQSWLGHSNLDIEIGQFSATFSRDPRYKDSLQRVREALAIRQGKAVNLKPAPIARLDASFRVPVKDNDGNILDVQLSGRISSDHALTENESIAESLQLTAYLEGQSLVVLRNLFLEGNAAASLDYTYIAAKQGEGGDTILATDNVPISIDLRRWPELSVIRDMAHLARNGYPILQVVCDDFRKDNPSIDEKAVDIEAESVAGRRVAKTIIFNSDPQAPTLVPVDFSYAVRVDRPYQYRTRTIDLAGEETTSPWIKANDWVNLLDITDRDDEPVKSRRSYVFEENSTANEVKL